MKKGILIFLGGALTGAGLYALGEYIYKKCKLEEIESVEWEMPEDDRDEEHAPEEIPSPIVIADHGRLEREELVKRLANYKAAVMADLEKDDNEVKLEKDAPLIHSDEDGASADFDEIETPIARDSIFEIEEGDVSDGGNNFTCFCTFFADGVLADEHDNPIGLKALINGIALDEKDLYAKFERNGYDDICIRDTNSGTDYVISWTDDSYKEVKG